MTKMRVHELAKELGIENKELIEILQKKNVEVKNHMSSLEDSVAEEIRREHSGKKTAKQEPEKAGEAHADSAKAESSDAKEAPKKKNLAFVIRPQNSRNSSRIQGNRQAQRPARPGQQGAGGAGLHDDGLPVGDHLGRPLGDAELLLVVVPHAGGGVVAVVHGDGPAVGAFEHPLVLQLL